MFDFLNRKTKISIVCITLLGISSLLAKGYIDYSNYKNLKKINNKLKK